MQGLKFYLLSWMSSSLFLYFLSVCLIPPRFATFFSRRFRIWKKLQALSGVIWFPGCSWHNSQNLGTRWNLPNWNSNLSRQLLHFWLIQNSCSTRRSRPGSKDSRLHWSQGPSPRFYWRSISGRLCCLCCRLWVRRHRSELDARIIGFIFSVYVGLDMSCPYPISKSMEASRPYPGRLSIQIATRCRWLLVSLFL